MLILYADIIVTRKFNQSFVYRMNIYKFDDIFQIVPIFGKMMIHI